MAKQKLEHCSNPDANGKDISTAVEWFIANYEDKTFELLLSNYIDDFIERKKKRRIPKTVEEIEYCLIILAMSLVQEAL